MTNPSRSKSKRREGFMSKTRRFVQWFGANTENAAEPGCLLEACKTPRKLRAAIANAEGA